MMTMDVVVTSRETIKPFSPTPLELRSYTLSLIDQYTLPKFYIPLMLSSSAEVENTKNSPELLIEGIKENNSVDSSNGGVEYLKADRVKGQLNQVLTSPAFYIPLILFYSAEEDCCNKFDNMKMSDRLKKSLSQALTDFYPLAGRVSDNYTINCNDSGVEYLEARVTGKLNHFLSCPRANELNKLLPCDLHCNGTSFEGLLAIQVNIFDCGGMAIAVCVSHIPTDAWTLCTFINAWANNARGADTSVSPKLDSASVFPPSEAPSTTMVFEDGGPMEKYVSKRFVFDGLKIASLRAKSMNASCVDCPTRVEAVSALIWKCLMNVVRLKPRYYKSCLLNMVVNLRSRMTSLLSQHSFGNLVLGAISLTTTDEKDAELHCLVAQLRKSIRKIGGDYLENLRFNNKLMFEHLKQEREPFLKDDVKAYIFTSWCRFPYYETDFGWGKPIWVTSINLILNNTVTLMDTKTGEGIEAWVTLDKLDMARFECEQELLAFACANPSYEPVTHHD